MTPAVLLRMSPAVVQVHIRGCCNGFNVGLFVKVKLELQWLDSVLPPLPEFSARIC